MTLDVGAQRVKYNNTLLLVVVVVVFHRSHINIIITLMSGMFTFKIEFIKLLKHILINTINKY
jgi:hypothetical protein